MSILLAVNELLFSSYINTTSINPRRRAMASQALVAILRTTRCDKQHILSTTGESYRFVFGSPESGAKDDGDGDGEGHVLESYSRAIVKGALARAKLHALPKIVWNILRVLARALRPYMLLAGAARSLVILVRWIRQRGSTPIAKSWRDTLTLLSTALCFREHVRDVYHVNDGFGAAALPAAGIYAHPKKSTRLARALRGLPRRPEFSRRNSSLLLGGDVQSILPGVAAKFGFSPFPSMDIVPMRIEWTGERESLAIDWIVGGSIPLDCAKGIVLFLPGVGGGSRESYIASLAKGYIKEEYAALVLHPRGLGPERSQTGKYI